MKKQSETRKKADRHCPMIILCIFSLVFSLAIAKIFVANRLSTAGIRIEGIEQKTAILNDENNRLRGEITRLSSLSYISSQATKIGFKNNGSVASLTFDIPIALR